MGDYLNTKAMLWKFSIPTCILAVVFLKIYYNALKLLLITLYITSRLTAYGDIEVTGMAWPVLAAACFEAVFLNTSHTGCDIS